MIARFFRKLIICLRCSAPVKAKKLWKLSLAGIIKTMSAMARLESEQDRQSSAKFKKNRYRQENGTATIPFEDKELAVPDQSPTFPKPLRKKIKLSRILAHTKYNIVFINSFFANDLLQSTPTSG